MKKMLTVAAAALIGASLFAETITSANVVGYVKTQTPPAGVYSIVAISQFGDGSTNNTINIQDAIGNLSELNADVAGSRKKNADHLFIFTGSGYNHFALFQPESGKPYWISSDHPIWYIQGEEVTPSTYTIDRGTSCWFQTAESGSSKALLSCGDVYLGKTFKMAINSGYTLVSYPFSSEISLDDLVIANATAAKAGSRKAGVDQIAIFTGKGYDHFALFEPSSGAPYWTSAEDPAWYIPGEDAAPATEKIKLGEGFWYKSETPKEISFQTNYTID